MPNELAERLLRQLSAESRKRIKDECRKRAYGWRELKGRLCAAMCADEESETLGILAEIGVPAESRKRFSWYLRSQRFALGDGFTP